MTKALTLEQVKRAISELCESKPMTEQELEAAVNQLDDYAMTASIYALWAKGNLAIGWTIEDGLTLRLLKPYRAGD